MGARRRVKIVEVLVWNIIAFVLQKIFKPFSISSFLEL